MSVHRGCLYIIPKVNVFFFVIHTSLHLLSYYIRHKFQALSSHYNYKSTVSSPASALTLEKENYLLLCSKVLLRRLSDVTSDWKITLLTRRTSLTTLTWHACHSAATNYSTSIAQLCRKLLIMAQENPTMRSLTKEFSPAFHPLRSSPFTSRRASEELPALCSGLSLSPSSKVGALSLHHYWQNCHFQLPRPFEPPLQLVAQVQVEMSLHQRWFQRWRAVITSHDAW